MIVQVSSLSVSHQLPGVGFCSQPQRVSAAANETDASRSAAPESRIASDFINISPPEIGRDYAYFRSSSNAVSAAKAKRAAAWQWMAVESKPGSGRLAGSSVRQISVQPRMT